MRSKRLVPRSLARRDVEAAIAHHLGQGARDAALDFIDVLEAACAQIGRYPFLVFYVERPHHINVWRVLHDQRDVAAWMWEPPVIG